MDASDSSDAPAEARDQELFTRKVVIIGDLQTKRALWANRVGQLKSGMLIAEVDDPPVGKETIEDLEERVSELSKKITGFKGQDIEALERLQKEAEDEFASMEAALGEKVSSQ